MAILLLSITGARLSAAQDVTGLWASNNGAIYYVRQIGNTVWWAGFDPDPFSPVMNKSNSFQRGMTSTQVFQGTLTGNTVSGNWTEVPRESSSTLNQGTLTFGLTLDSAGNVVSLQLQSQTGGLTATSWTRTSIPALPCADKTGQRDIYCLFGKVLKNQTEAVWGSHESLLDNLKPYKDNVVVFGTVAAAYRDLINPTNCAEFFANNSNDDDLNFDIIADRANLDAQPGFWTDGWRNPASNIQGKLNAWQNAIHCETIAFGRQSTQCQPTDPVFLPGYAEMGANSSLSQGVPIANGLVPIGNTVAIQGSPQMNVGNRVRVTGPMILDCGHGLTSPCYETDNDPNNPDSKNLEIHPVYSIDILQDYTAPRPPNIDLSGLWAASDVGTYYVRQIGNTIWWLGLSRDQGLTFANVFLGTVQDSGAVNAGAATTTAARASAATKRVRPPGSTPPITIGGMPVITGQWASLPLGSTQGNGSLTLVGNFCQNPANTAAACDNGVSTTAWNVLATQTSSSPLFANPLNGSFQWQKLYDRSPTGVPQIVVPQTLVAGRIPSGSEFAASVPVINSGTAPLIIQSITSSPHDLIFSPTTLTVPPGGLTGFVTVRWLVIYSETGYLTLKSNDPSRPVVTITLQVTSTGGPPR